MSERTSSLATSEGAFEPGVALGEINPFSLIDAVNAASRSSRTGLALFLGIVGYVSIATAAVTNKDLLLDAPVSLPLLGVAVSQQMFFLLAPLLLVALHYGLLLQHVALARKAMEFDAAVRVMEPTLLRSNPVRHELESYVLTQALAGPERPALLGGLLDLMFWLTVVAAPLAAILFVQITYLPYHDVAITMMHRLALVLDIVLLSIMSAFLSSRATSFLGAFARTIGHYPSSVLTTLVLYVAIVGFSFLIATVPDEPLDRLTQMLPSKAGAPAAHQGEAMNVAEGVWNRILNLAANRSFIPRNLSVTDWVVASPSRPLVSLRDRDLRFADLSRSQFPHADLTGADLSGANLAGANLAAADLRKVQAAGANLVGADLAGADLKDAKLVAADLAEADLQAASLTSADAVGASFRGARLQGADLSSALLQAADFAGAVMTAAGLEAAQIWQTRPPAAADATLADVSAVAIVQPADGVIAAIETQAKRLGPIDEQSAFVRLAAKLSDHSGPAWSEGDEAAVWAGLKQEALLGDLAQRRAKSVAYLGGLGCAAREQGAIVDGVIRRVLDAAKTSDPAALWKHLQGANCPAVQHASDRALRALQALGEKSPLPHDTADATVPADPAAGEKAAGTADAPQAAPSGQSQ